MITEKEIIKNGFIKTYPKVQGKSGFSKGRIMLRYNSMTGVIVDIKDYSKGWPGKILKENLSDVKEFNEFNKKYE